MYDVYLLSLSSFFFFFNDTATTEIYTLSLHDALPISGSSRRACRIFARRRGGRMGRPVDASRRFILDRKSTRLNSSHLGISYAVFCLKKKKNTKNQLDKDDRTTRDSLRELSWTELRST